MSEAARTLASFDNLAWNYQVGPPAPEFVVEFDRPVAPEKLAILADQLREYQGGPLVLAEGARIRWREDSRAQAILSEPIRESVDWSTRILSLGAFIVAWAALFVAVLR